MKLGTSTMFQALDDLCMVTYDFLAMFHWTLFNTPTNMAVMQQGFKTSFQDWCSLTMQLG
jgi:hypothetical protein